MYNQRSLSRGVDVTLILLSILLVLVGVLCIFSVEYRSQDNVMQNILGLKKNYSRQLIIYRDLCCCCRTDLAHRQ